MRLSKVTGTPIPVVCLYLKYSCLRSLQVEYSDPSNIFPLAEAELTQRLPLRNLHWTSLTRPLRSIDSLHVSFHQNDTRSSLPSSQPQVQDSSQDGSQEEGIAAVARPGNSGRSSSGLNSKKERRHQIPGLRQTPYLKIYFLRCSDLEAYRSTWRKEIREWVKENTPAFQSNSLANAQENHDAFEWLIVHVALPQDGHVSSSALNNSNNDSRAASRNPITILEKLRADFNGASKTAVDRVAQIQITPIAEWTQSKSEGSSPRSNSWNDLISKMKLLILASFDLRVTQYEDDIKEKESQRNLPGWNFNTFFVLKEGLARGFESVGLIEDALTGYHELSVELNAILENKDTGILADHQKAHFKETTDELAAELRSLLQLEQSNGPQTSSGDAPSAGLSASKLERPYDLGANILNTNRKPFRELILANNISKFDFQCYLFAREISLLLRSANVGVLRDDGKEVLATDPVSMDKTAFSENKGLLITDNESHADFTVLAKICSRSLKFLTSVGRTMRDDLRCSIDPLSKSHQERKTSIDATCEDLIENLIVSWIYSACQCVLDVTLTKSLSAQLQPLLRQLKSQEAENGHNDTTMSISRESLPSRTSSLPPSARASPGSSSPDNFPSIMALDAIRLLPPPTQTGTQELAAERAELIAMQRRILTTVAPAHRSFSNDKAQSLSPSSTISEDFEGVTLDDHASDNVTPDFKAAGVDEEPKRDLKKSGIINRRLRSFITSERSFYDAYEVCTFSFLSWEYISKLLLGVDSPYCRLIRSRQ